MIPVKGIQSQKGHPRFFTKRVEVMAPMNINPACPNEISPVVLRSHMLIAIMMLMHIMIIRLKLVTKEGAQ
jgi:hypothetical protein